LASTCGTVTAFDLPCGAGDWARAVVDIVEKPTKQVRARTEQRIVRPTYEAAFTVTSDQEIAWPVARKGFIENPDRSW
jgi:hypothetical protein